MHLEIQDGQRKCSMHQWKIFLAMHDFNKYPALFASTSYSFVNTVKLDTYQRYIKLSHMTPLQYFNMLK